MWFKNLLIYRFNKEFTVDDQQLEQALAEYAFHPCTTQEISSFGFTSVMGKQGKMLSHGANGRYLIAARKEEKMLPSAVIKETLEEQVAELEDKEQRKLTKKEKDALKEEIITTLLPRAFSRHSRIQALILPEQQLLLVDSASHNKAEELLALLRKALGSLPVVPLSFDYPVAAQLTDWLKAGRAPAPFHIQEEAELKSLSDEGGIVRFKQQDLLEEEVLAHLATGKYVHKLALHFEASIGLVLDNDVGLKRLKFAEEFRFKNDELGNDDPAARLDADLALMSGELVALTQSLIEVFSAATDPATETTASAQSTETAKA